MGILDMLGGQKGSDPVIYGDEKIMSNKAHGKISLISNCA